ncbi:MAG: hypothetical protein AB7V08_14595 [Elusimicrobiales bacterium]
MTRLARKGAAAGVSGRGGGARGTARDPGPPRLRESAAGEKNAFHVGETLFARAPRRRRGKNLGPAPRARRGREKAAKRTGKKHKAFRKTQIFVYNMGMAQERFSDEKTGEKIFFKNT